MANEFIGIGTNQPNGRVETQMVYVFPISPRVVDSNGADVVPAYDLATLPDHFQSQLTPAQVNAIQQGDAGFILTSLTKSAGDGDGAFAARARQDYDALTAFYLQARRDKAAAVNTFDLRRFAFNR